MACWWHPLLFTIHVLAYLSALAGTLLLWHNSALLITLKMGIEELKKDFDNFRPRHNEGMGESHAGGNEASNVIIFLENFTTFCSIGLLATVNACSLLNIYMSLFFILPPVTRQKLPGLIWSWKHVWKDVYGLWPGEKIHACPPKVDVDALRNDFDDIDEVVLDIQFATDDESAASPTVSLNPGEYQDPWPFENQSQ